MKGQKDHTPVICQLCGKTIDKCNLKNHWLNYHCNGQKPTIEFIKNYYDTYIEPETEHKCKICGKPARFTLLPLNGKRNPWGGYNETCCNSCRSILSNKNFYEQWHNEHPNESKILTGFSKPEVQEKIKQNVKLKYGVDNISQINEIKNKKRKTLEQNGYVILDSSGNFKWTDKWRDSVKKANQEKYGVDWPTQIPEAREKAKRTMIKRYGVENPGQSAVIRERVYDTKDKNNSWFISKLENTFYDALCQIYGESDIIRQYRDYRYANPYNGRRYSCDLYIKSKDIFIEIQGYKTHGNKPSDGTETPKSLQLTVKEFASFQTDILKRSIAKSKNLKLLEIFILNYDCITIDNINAFIKSEKPIWTIDNKFIDYPENTVFKII